MLTALLGGVLIGLAASFFLLLNGRVTGISGILSGALAFKSGDFGWRVAFLLGLVAGGGVLRFLHPEAFQADFEMFPWAAGLAGFLVGFGTVLGNGCTSGHGVCGIARLSVRSIVATVVFMAAGILTVAALRRWLSV